MWLIISALVVLAQMDEMYNMQPEEEALLAYEAEVERRELSSRMSEIEENGLYVRNLLNHMNDKMVQPVARTVMPAITLAVSSAGTVATVALGVLYLIMKLR